MAGEQFVLSARDDTRAVFESVKRNIEGVERAAAGIRSSFGALAGVLSAGIFAGFVRSGIDAADALDDVAEKVGITVESLSALQYAGKVSGTSAEQLGDGLKKLAVNLQAGAQGSKEMQDAFARVGIAAGDLSRLQSDEALKRIATAFGGMSNGAEKTALAIKLFGKSGADMIPILNLGATGLANAAREAQAFGAIVSTEAAAAAAKFNDNLARLSAGFEGFKVAASSSIVAGLNQIVEGMLAATREGGVLMGVLRGLGEAGKIALQAGADPGAIQKQREYILSIQGEIARLQDSAAGKGTLGTGLLDRLIFGDAKEKQRKLAELKITLRDAEAALVNIRKLQQSAPPAAAGGGAGGGAAARAAPRAVSDAGGQDMVDRYNDAEFIRRLDEVARERAEREAEIIRGIGVGPETVQRAMDAREAQLQSLRGQTKTGQRNAVYADLKLLNEAFDAGKLSADELGEAYGNLTARLEDIDRGAKSVAAISIKPFADDTASQLRELESAVRGFGNRFTDALVGMFSKARVDINEVLRSIANDVLRMTIQKSVTQPLFNNLAGFAAQIFQGAGAGAAGTGPVKTETMVPAFFQTYGGGRASGGPVDAGTMYTVGESGRELFVPKTSGTIVPNNALGGTKVTIINNIDARSDVASINAAMRLTERRLLDTLATRGRR